MFAAWFEEPLAVQISGIVEAMPPRAVNRYAAALRMANTLLGRDWVERNSWWESMYRCDSSGISGVQHQHGV